MRSPTRSRRRIHVPNGDSGIHPRVTRLAMSTILNDGPAIDASRLLAVLKAVRKGDFSARLPEDWTGIAGKVADTFNEVVEMNERLAVELARVSVVVGRNGKIDERASLGPVSGSWSD